MKILSFDTSSKILSVSISEDDNLIAQKISTEENKHVEMLFSYVGRLFQELSLSYDNIDMISANIGPGNFTGLRAGLAAVQGICLVKNIVFMPVNTMEAFFMKYKSNIDKNLFKEVIVLLDAKRNELFTQKFSIDELVVGKPTLMKEDEVERLFQKNIAFLSNKYLKIFEEQNKLNYSYVNTNDDKAELIKACDISLTALFKKKLGYEFGQAKPLYMREADAKISIKQ